MPTYDRYQRKVKFSKISKLAVYLHITYFTAWIGNFQKWCLPRRRAFALLSTRKQIHAPVFSGPSENSFVRIHLLEHRYGGGLTTLKTRDAHTRRKAVAVLVWVMRLYGRWRPLSVEVQGNLCGREAVSYRCRVRLCSKFCADGFAWNLTMPCYHTAGLGQLELQMTSGWSGLLPWVTGAE
jgi:hypothetical protein